MRESAEGSGQEGESGAEAKEQIVVPLTTSPKLIELVEFMKGREVNWGQVERYIRNARGQGRLRAKKFLDITSIAAEVHARMGIEAFARQNPGVVNLAPFSGDDLSRGVRYRYGPFGSLYVEALQPAGSGSALYSDKIEIDNVITLPDEQQEGKEMLVTIEVKSQQRAHGELNRSLSVGAINRRHRSFLRMERLASHADVLFGMPTAMTDTEPQQEYRQHGGILEPFAGIHDFGRANAAAVAERLRLPGR